MASPAFLTHNKTAIGMQYLAARFLANAANIIDQNVYLSEEIHSIINHLVHLIVIAKIGRDNSVLDETSHQGLKATSAALQNLEGFFASTIVTPPKPPRVQRTSP